MIDITSYINPTLAIILWAIGILIKHTNAFKKIPNNYIPAILSVIGIILNLAMNGASLDSTLAGFVTAMVCVGVHKSGTNTFGVNGLDIGSIFNSTNTDIELPDQSDDDL